MNCAWSGLAYSSTGEALGWPTVWCTLDQVSFYLSMTSTSGSASKSWSILSPGTHKFDITYATSWNGRIKEYTYGYASGTLTVTCSGKYPVSTALPAWKVYHLDENNDCIYDSVSIEWEQTYPRCLGWGSPAQCEPEPLQYWLKDPNLPARFRIDFQGYQTNGEVIDWGAAETPRYSLKLFHAPDSLWFKLYGYKRMIVWQQWTRADESTITDPVGDTWKLIGIKSQPRVLIGKGDFGVYGTDLAVVNRLESDLGVAWWDGTESEWSTYFEISTKTYETKLYTVDFNDLSGLCGGIRFVHSYESWYWAQNVNDANMVKELVYTSPPWGIDTRTDTSQC